jgi:hypothetical protein
MYHFTLLFYLYTLFPSWYMPPNMNLCFSLRGFSVQSHALDNPLLGITCVTHVCVFVFVGCGTCNVYLLPPPCF